MRSKMYLCALAVALLALAASAARASATCPSTCSRTAPT